MLVWVLDRTQNADDVDRTYSDCLQCLSSDLQAKVKAFLAASTAHRVGIDLTTLDMSPAKTADEFLSYFDEQFGRLEWDWIRKAASDAEKVKRFHCLWALKESYVKGVGCGIIVDLVKICFLVSEYNASNPSAIRIWDTPLSVTLVVEGAICKDWSFQVVSVDSFHILSLACNPPQSGEPAVAVERVTWLDLATKACALPAVDADRP
ncbi:hypothetical protein BC831DRAFT_248919 [Entophlyctis helioformis]|nr:hypothetical protein BC831DRAFT_248919 [Entophlyctis helioformis]